MEMVKKQSGIEVLHVPFTGEAPAVTALIAGQVDLMVLPAGSAARQAGKVKDLAVTVPERFFILPNTPSLKEEGYANVNVFNWFGVVAPAKTPEPVVQRLAQEIAAVLNSDELKSKYRGMGLDVHPPMSQPEFNKFIASEIARWGDVIKSANIRLD
jgi:tripartite-type tricarboxylate transporter receptor subunit TctC